MSQAWGTITPALLAVVFAFSMTVHAHPQCLDFMPPFEPAEPLSLCREYSKFGCCTREQDYELKKQFDEILRSLPQSSRTVCEKHVTNILCQECSPYASHLYDLETTQVKKPLPGLCPKYCSSIPSECINALLSTTVDPSVRKTLSPSDPKKFCESTKITDMDYCYPDIITNENFSNDIQKAIQGTGGEKCLCFKQLVVGLRNPTVLVHAGDGSHRVFIGEQYGKVHVYLSDFSKVETPFLDLSKNILTSTRRGDERGFLGMAFHPDFKHNSRLFVYYSIGNDKHQKIRISEFRIASHDANQVDRASEKVILELDEPAGNHNGGQLLFGVDGYLYAFTGDGGKAGDPWGKRGNGQNLSSLLGKVIRIDINRPDDSVPYVVPEDNPFVGQPNVRPEIYAYGQRNSWRCSMDRGDPETGKGRGRIFCGDVGQGKWEEVDIIQKGGNYGWRAFEGFECFDKKLCKTPELANHIPPIHVYGHSVGKSITGGYMYRGCLFPNLRGQYIYGDYMTGLLFSLTEDAKTGAWNNRVVCVGGDDTCNNGVRGSYVPNILSFGEDEAGELYMLATDFASTSHEGGVVYRLVDPSRRADPGQCRKNITPVGVLGSMIRNIITSWDDIIEGWGAKREREGHGRRHPLWKEN
ncbi:PREDICTED: HHIP-like protein 2 isoform X1 [Branchiostoma belcheri]|uniref:HHIP-like protein 2 isoform X1 n=2 Tax=Branchiostoma belcheri TaxID=7741 RepID=A0A6P4Y2M3_BRABE|nr:PREDICTED: HHIP-like protein 2 isoform X1 [Branchiostoma belcheri]